MFVFRLIPIFFTLYMLVGCSGSSANKGNENEDGSYELSIEISAGDDYFEVVQQDTFAFTPYPYNFGTIRSGSDIKLSCMVISNRLSRKSRIDVLPIGILNYREFDQDKKLIITIPRNPEDRVVDADVLIDLVTKYPAIKNMIQDWTVGKCGIGCARFLSWGDENAAGLWIQRNLSS